MEEEEEEEENWEIKVYLFDEKFWIMKKNPDERES